MSCEAYCNCSSTQLDISPSKRKVNNYFINKGIANWVFWFTYKFPITSIICHFSSKSCYSILFPHRILYLLISNTTPTLFLFTASSTLKRVELWLDIWVIKEIDDSFKVVILGQFD